VTAVHVLRPSATSRRLYSVVLLLCLVVFTARRYYSAVDYMLSSLVCPSVYVYVRLSVSLSVTNRHCTKMVKCRITLTPYDSPGTLFFRRHRSRWNSNGVTPMPQRAPPIAVGYIVLNRRFSTNISLYLNIGTYSYYGKLIGTRMSSIDWCYFQWPWATLP